MSNLYLPIILGTLIFLFLFGCLTKLLSNNQSRHYPYKKVAGLLSNAELSFLRILKQSVSNDHIVFSKVRIADVIQVKKALSESRYQKALNKIQAKHFDYVICSNKTSEPLVAVELDDATHNKKERRKRDFFVNKAAESASLPLVRIPAKRRYSKSDIRQQVASYLG